MLKRGGVEVCSRASNGYLRRLIQALAVSVGVIIFSLASFSQTNFGRISGTVTDQTGGAIVGATVTVTDTARGVSRTLTTDAAGQYTAPSLVPSTYLVHVEFSGFSAAEQRNVEVPVAGDVRADLQVQPSSQTQTVTVTEAAPQINVTNATISDTMENSEVTNLPVSGGHWEYLFALRPGMLSKPGGGAKSQSSNGLRVEQNTWLFDGMYNGKLSNGGVILGAQVNITDQGNILPLDAVQEFNFVQEPKAEYGWKSGGTVDAGIKSGTNAIHGSGHIEGRDAALVANNFFTPANTPKPVSNFVQFGASVGGPIKKDKLFYFADFEAQRYNVGLPQRYVVPTTASYVGLTGAASPSFSFPDAIADLNTNHVAVSALSAAMAGCTAGLTSTNPAAVVCSVANQGGEGGLFGNSGLAQKEIVENQVGGSNNGIARIDYQLNGHNSINGDIFWGGSPLITAGKNIQPFFRPVGSSYAQMARGTWIWTPTSSLVNTARFGFDRIFIGTQNGDCILPHPNYASLGFVTGVPNVHYPFNVDEPSSCGFPYMTITNLSYTGSDTAQLEWDRYPAASDDVAWTKGAHQFLFGGEVRWQFIGGGAGANTVGTLAFGSTAAFTGATSLEDFMTGTASSTGSSLVNNPKGSLQALRSNDYAIFAQDDWRVTRKLTLNLGLRYEYQQPWWDEHNFWSNFNTASPTGLISQTGSIRVTNGNFTRGIMPRFGLAYDITGKSTTVVRAGFAVMNNFEDEFGIGDGRLNLNPTGALFYNATGQTLQGTGPQNTGTVALSSAAIKAQWLPNNPIFGPVLSSTTKCGNGVGANPSPCNIWGADPNIAPAPVYEWNVSVQHAFTNTTSLTVAYVGNHASNLWMNPDINAPIPGSGYVLSGTPAVLTTTQSAEQVKRPYYTQFPWFGILSGIEPSGESSYNALQTTFTQRVSHGLTGTLGYTYGHQLDTGTSDFVTARPQNPYDLAAEYGDADTDIRHRVSITTNYLLPSKKSRAQMLQGWQLNSTYLFYTASPVNVEDTTSNISGTGDEFDRWTLVGNPKQFPVGHAANLPCYGIAASTFGKTANCTSVPAIANMPAACVNAATNEPVNTTNPVLAGTTGLTSLAKYGCYMENSTVIVPPAPGTFGSMGRNILRGPGYQEWDLSLSKSWQIREGMTAQAIISAFNVLNNVDFQPPSTEDSGGTASSPNSPSVFGQAQSTTDAAQMSAVLGQGGPRKFQFGVKFIF